MLFTYWGLNKLSNILHTLFLNAFPRIKIDIMIRISMEFVSKDAIGSMCRRVMVCHQTVAKQLPEPMAFKDYNGLIYE